ncbi:MAG TPA: zinc ribbon domain-containing protein [Anaerolineae bacterium]|nr:zinc ribbon domain-containing protein [Anaerolineae bacterium]
MQCSHCGAKNKESAKFCQACGRPLIPETESQAHPQVVVVTPERRRSWGCLWGFAGVFATLLILFLLVWLNIVEVPPVNSAANLPAPIIDAWQAIRDWQQKPGGPEGEDEPIVGGEPPGDGDEPIIGGEPPVPDVCAVEIDDATAYVIGIVHTATNPVNQTTVEYFGVDICFDSEHELDALDALLLSIDNYWVQCNFEDSPDENCCRHYVNVDLQESYRFDRRVWVEAYYSPDWEPGNIHYHPSPISSANWGPDFEVCTLFDGWVDMPEIEAIDDDDDDDFCPEVLNELNRVDYACGTAGMDMQLRLSSDWFGHTQGEHAIDLGEDVSGWFCSPMDDYAYILECRNVPFAEWTNYVDLTVHYQLVDSYCRLANVEDVWYPSSQDMGCAQTRCESIVAQGGSGFPTFDPAECAAAGGTLLGGSYCECSP